jgi:hypothetical protein
MAPLKLYKQLGDNEIRIAEIKSTSNEADDVHCHLLHVSRDEPGGYQALSYAWGPPQERGIGQIYLEGTSHAVTRTMEIALRKLRRKDGEPPLMIWIDALCINQQDDDEKCEQVEKMRTIYQQATEVSIWLGPEDWSLQSSLAWQLIRDLYNCPRDVDALSNIIQPSRKTEFDALVRFFRRDYFWRIWVVQEVACAAKATVYFGSDSIPWSGLVEVCDKLSDARAFLRRAIYHDKPASLFSLMTGGPKNLVLSKGVTSPFSETTAPSLLDLLSAHLSKGSTLQHDKVYGIVGVSADRDSFGKIDYGRSVRATYIHTARHIISTIGRLDVICMQQNDDNVHDLPSWVADWERRNLFPKHRVVSLRYRTPGFTASGSSIARVSFSHNDEVLTAAGFVVDTIKTVSQPLYVHGPENEVLPTLEKFRDWWNVFVNNVGSSDEDLAVFQRTFCGGSWAPSYSEGEFKEDQTHRLTLFFGLMQRLLPHLIPEGSPISLTMPANAAADEMIERCERAMVSSAALRMHAKRLVISNEKLAGLAPQLAEVGDKVVVLLGCNFPVVLREVDCRCEFIGEIYLDGIMHGEAMEGLKSGKYKEQNFEIH